MDEAFASRVDISFEAYKNLAQVYALVEKFEMLFRYPCTLNEIHVLCPYYGEIFPYFKLKTVVEGLDKWSNDGIRFVALPNLTKSQSYLSPLDVSTSEKNVFSSSDVSTLERAAYEWENFDIEAIRQQILERKAKKRTFSKAVMSLFHR